MYLNTRIFLTTGYARVLLCMFIRRELGGMGTGCLFQFTYCGQGWAYMGQGENSIQTNDSVMLSAVLNINK